MKGRSKKGYYSLLGLGGREKTGARGCTNMTCPKYYHKYSGITKRLRCNPFVNIETNENFNAHNFSANNWIHNSLKISLCSNIDEYLQIIRTFYKEDVLNLLYAY